MIRPIIIAALAASVVSGWAGWSLRDRDYQTHLKLDAEASLTRSEGAREIEGNNEHIATDVGLKVEETKVQVQYVTRTLIKEIPIYVTTEADARCVVPLGAVRLHDAAATGDPTPTFAPGESPDQPSGSDLSSVVSTVIDNYGYTRELEAQVVGWQDWYAAVARDWPSKDGWRDREQP